MSCIGNFIKKLWLCSANLYFAQRIFIWRTEFQNGFSFCMDVELIKLTYTLQRGARSNHFLVLFCYFLIFWIFFHTEWNSKMDYPLAQIWSLSRSQRTPKMSCIGNSIKKLWLRSANLYFAQLIFMWRTEFQNQCSFCMDVELIK